MKKLAVLCFLFPSFLSVPLRRLLGQKRISPKARVRWGTILLVDDPILADGVSIGPFSLIQARSFEMQTRARVGPLVLIRCFHLFLGARSTTSLCSVVWGQYSPMSKLHLGDFSQIFPLCWLDPGHGIEIGKYVGVGGHTLIFTHGNWTNYLEGGPINGGPVRIGDRVHLSWRCFVAPNVAIGDDAVIATGAVVIKDIPARALAGGMPAKVIRENFITEPSLIDKKSRLREVWDHYQEFYQSRISAGLSAPEILCDRLFIDEELSDARRPMIWNFADLSEAKLQEYQRLGLGVVDYRRSLAYLPAQGVHQKSAREFVGYITRYGIRLDVQEYSIN